MPRTSVGKRGAIINAGRAREPKSVLHLNSVSYSATCFSFCLHSYHARKWGSYSYPRCADEETEGRGRPARATADARRPCASTRCGRHGRSPRCASPQLSSPQGAFALRSRSGRPGGFLGIIITSQAPPAAAEGSGKPERDGSPVRERTGARPWSAHPTTFPRRPQCGPGAARAAGLQRAGPGAAPQEASVQGGSR